MSATETDGGPRIACVEAGGTTFRVSLLRAYEDADTVAPTIVPTTSPEETMSAVVAALKEHEPFDAIGVASFGPIELDRESEHYGYITTTPKPAWGYADVLGPLGVAFSAGDESPLPTAWETDVNAAAVAEARFGDGGPVRSCAYVTVGTGVGVGIVTDGGPIHGLLHPEMGHICVPRAPGDEDFAGTCPYHGACVEGMISAGAVAARFGCDPSELAEQDDDAAAWDAVAHYLAHLAATITLTVSPEKIVIGGGLLQRAGLYPKIRSQCAAILNSYIKVPRVTDGMESYIVAPRFESSGLVGAFLLASDLIGSEVAAPGE